MGIQLEVNIRETYLRWIGERLRIDPLPEANWYEISLPYLDRHNDYLTVYVNWVGDEVLITDAGWMLADLSASGWEADTDTRRELLQEILTQFQITCRENDELSVSTNAAEFPRVLHNMAQALLAMNDLPFTSGHR